MSQCSKCKCYYNECHGHECPAGLKSVAELVKEQTGYRMEYDENGLVCRLVWTPPQPTHGATP